MSRSVLLVERKDGVATLTLNRPEQMNALSMELRRLLAEELEALRHDDEIGVVILTGAGRAFCAGLDLKEMGGERPAEATGSGDPPDPARMLRRLRQPVIGAVNGVAVTGGFEIALACDMLVATPEAQFADTHARVGLLAGWGLSQRLSRIVGPNRARELSLTGNYLSAERAERWGLVNRVVPRGELLPTCEALARDMLSCVPEVLFEYKSLIDRGFDLALGDAMTYEAEIARRHPSPPPEVVAERRLAIQQRGRAQAACGESAR
ncbi:MAG: enoyl-CoA hydratase [Gammaproteobacteria bacterium]|nr:enoyl-CoA hydratase [Gammaproteobacteria bacterium]